ncbi:MAG: hypothetical protein ACQET5_04205 [Halobacteriota archaeon]|uniref:hypothetical protein n=1 Tax=Natronomonas sp. TaxID=2184060 RepID=UPI0039765C15
MVVDELTDGKRLGQLLASEIHGHERDVFGRLVVVDADAEIEPTEAGTLAYAIGIEIENDGDDSGHGDRIAKAYVHPDRLRVEFSAVPDVAADVGREEGLRTRPKAVDPPRTLVFVENGAEVKAALRVVRAIASERFEEKR